MNKFLRSIHLEIKCVTETQIPHFSLEFQKQEKQEIPGEICFKMSMHKNNN